MIREREGIRIQTGLQEKIDGLRESGTNTGSEDFFQKLTNLSIDRADRNFAGQMVWNEHIHVPQMVGQIAVKFHC